MTTLTQKTTRLTEAVGNLIDQFKGRDNLEAFIRAWAQQSQEVENAAFEVLTETTIASAVGVQLDGLGTIVGVERGGRNDADYRVRIGAQILLNGASGTIEDLLQLCVALGATTATLAEVFPAKIDLASTTTLTSGAEIGNTLAQAKPAGVGFNFTWWEDTPPFLFGVTGQGFDQGKLGGIVTA